MNHLGDRLAAYVDGELPRVTRELITAHLALCSSCRAAVDAETRLKQGLTGLGEPAPSTNLLGALLELAEPGEPMPPRRRPLDAEPSPQVATVGRPIRVAFVGLAAPAVPFETRGSRARRFMLAAGALGIAALTLASAHAQNAGVDPAPVPSDNPLAARVVGGSGPTPHDLAEVFGAGVPAVAQFPSGPNDANVFYGHIYAGR